MHDRECGSGQGRVTAAVVLLGTLISTSCSGPDRGADPPDLSSPSVLRRAAALDFVIASANRPPHLLPRIAALLDDRDETVAGKAAVALGGYGRDSYPELHRLLRDGSLRQKWGATIALSRMTTDIRPFTAQMTAQLSAADIPLLQATLAVLVHMQDRAAPATHDLVNLLDHEVIEIRIAALEALAAVGPMATAAIPAMRRCLEDEAHEVREAAADALCHVRPSKPVSSKRLARHIHWLQQNVPSLLEMHRVPGTSIAILHDGRLDWAGGFGVRDANDRSPVTSETVFEACSMSKPVLALCALKLIHLGKLDLDSPLVNYLGGNYVPDQPEHRQITARMVLTHRTGFPNWRAGFDEMQGPLVLLFPPGSQEGYSGEGFVYLQRAMEGITRQSLEQFARDTLFRPLGLRRTSFVASEAMDRELASGHTEEGTFKRRTHYQWPNGAYSLYTTPSEYARLMLTLITPAVLSDSRFSAGEIELLLRRHQRTSNDDPVVRPRSSQAMATYRGLAWRIDVTADGEIAYHSGANSSGFKTYGQFHRLNRSGLVIFTNGDNGTQVWEAIVRRIGDL